VKGCDALRRGIERLGAALERIPFSSLALIVCGAFVATRLPYFWFNPRVDLSLDSGGYLELASQFGKHHWPQLIWRTPGYPLFILLVTTFVDRWLAIVFVQNLLSFLSSLCLVYAVYRLRRSLALPAALAMCGFLGSSQVLIYDISILSESLYTSTMILIIACLFLGFARDRALYFLAASFLMGWSILDRPAAVYFAVIYLFIALGLLWNRCRPAVVAGFLAPFPVLILTLCTYNYVTAGKFMITAFAEANLAGATMLYWEPDPSLPPQVNTALESLPETYEKIGISREELALERTSWDTTQLFKLYAKAYNRLVWSSGFGAGSRLSGYDYMHNRTLVREAAMAAIRRHPSLYAKFVWVNLVEFFRDVGYKYDFNASMAYRISGPTPDKVKAADLTQGGGFPEPPTEPLRRVSDDPKHHDPSTPERLLQRLQIAWQTLHGFVFQNVVWSFAYFIVGALSLAQLARCRARHLGAFLLCVITLIPIGASLVVCMFEVALDRYSYPTQFIYYLSVALFPLLWFRGDFRGRALGSGAPAGKHQVTPA
jgi:hypothetical protein